MLQPPEWLANYASMLALGLVVWALFWVPEFRRQRRLFRRRGFSPADPLPDFSHAESRGDSSPAESGDRLIKAPAAVALLCGRPGEDSLLWSPSYLGQVFAWAWFAWVIIALFIPGTWTAVGFLVIPLVFGLALRLLLWRAARSHAGA
jgi:hypothetical protein